MDRLGLKEKISLELGFKNCPVLIYIFVDVVVVVVVVVVVKLCDRLIYLISFSINENIVKCSVLTVCLCVLLSLVN